MISLYQAYTCMACATRRRGSMSNVVQSVNIHNVQYVMPFSCIFILYVIVVIGCRSFNPCYIMIYDVIHNRGLALLTRLHCTIPYFAYKTCVCYTVYSTAPPCPVPSLCSLDQPTYTSCGKCMRNVSIICCKRTF